MNATRIQTISVLCPSGSTQISLSRFIRPRISTGAQNTITVAIAMRLFAPHEAKRNCLAKIKNEPANAYQQRQRMMLAQKNISITKHQHNKTSAANMNSTKSSSAP